MRLRILFVAPAYWPATAFGGPIPVMRELAMGLQSRGHTVEVVTTALTHIGSRPTMRTRVATDGGTTVHYLATPARFRWMGLTPSLPVTLSSVDTPDVVHVFGFRDPVGTVAAAWCRRSAIPYVFEGLGMFKPKLRKVGLKRVLDATLYRHVPRHAALAIACSSIERDEYIAGGIPSQSIAVRPNGFPSVQSVARGPLRRRLHLADNAPLVVSVGRVAEGKGLELLVEAMRDAPEAHLAIVGPDDGHGTTARLERLRSVHGLTDRVHLVGRLSHAEVLEVYADADVMALASAHESFGMVAAEAAAAGKAVLVTDRCGVADLLRDRAALVVPYSADAVRDGLLRLLADPELRARLGRGGAEVADEWSWPKVIALQESLYHRVAGST